MNKVTEEEIIDLVREEIEKAKDEIKKEISDFTDWCLEQGVLYPTKKHIDEFMKLKGVK